MKTIKLLPLLLLTLLTISFASCVGKSKNVRIKHVGPENGFVWHEINENGLLGAVDEYENILLPCQFKSIELTNDYANGNGALDYEWQLRFTVVDEKDREYHLTLWIFDDGWRYFNVYDKKREEFAIADAKLKIIIPYKYKSTETLFKMKSNWIVDQAPSITKYHLFYQHSSKDDGAGLFLEDGTPIISSDRGYERIVPCQVPGKCWYICPVKKQSYKDDCMIAVCDAHGTELFRYDESDCEDYDGEQNKYGYRLRHSWLPDEIQQYQWFGAYYSKNLAYDAPKGFTCFYTKHDRDGYAILDEYGDCIYKLHHTGIKLSETSCSFDVEPSGNNKSAKYINIAKYTQSSGSVYPSGDYYPIPTPTPTPTPDPNPYPDPNPTIDSHLTAEQYLRSYNGQEDVVKGIFRTFEIVPDMNYGPRTQNLQTLHEAQKEMRCIRQEAASHGITIQQSYYETASPR